MNSTKLYLRHGRMPNGSIADIAVEDGVITAIRAVGEEPPLDALVLDLNRDLICPGLINGHMHLDKTLIGYSWIPHRSAPSAADTAISESVAERIISEREIEVEISVPITERASKLIELAVSSGSSYLRTHVDIDPDVGLRRLQSMLEVREKYQDIVSIQIVAFPQKGVLCQPGVVDLLDAAIAEGADLVGGVDPANIDGDITGQLNAIFALADRRAVGLDIHLHDPGLLGIHELEQIAARTKANGMVGKVTASHSHCLGSVPEDVARRTAETLSRAGVAIVTYGPGVIPLPPIKMLRDTGVTVFAGSDNVRDAWTPYGNGDMLERARC